MTATGSSSPASPGANAPEPTERVLSTLNRDGSRRWLRPRPMPGRFMSWRRVVAYGLILLFTVIPYLRFGGRPLVLLDLPARQFTILGKTFLPTDTLLLALLLVTVFVGIFLATALLGRVWCGWACPQTVYMEFVFRPIERLFDGTPGRRRRWALQGTPAATVLKYLAFVLVACYLAHTFLAYFVGVEQLATWVRRSPIEHPTSFLVMLAVTGLMLFDFVFFREQTCIVACPYGRFQSVMLDPDSLIISYDQERGEPRGRMRRGGSRARTGRTSTPDVSLRVVNEPAPVSAGAPAEAAPSGDGEERGDCVDCGMCTVCCPTGIDIRDGLQLECVACAQCIDACDSVMTKIGRPTGLIRYSSEHAMQGRRWRLLRPRVVLYPLLLTILATAFVIVLLSTGAFDLSVTRGLGSPFTVLTEGMVANPAKVRIVNRTAQNATYTITATGAEGITIRLPDDAPIELDAGASTTVPVMIEAPPGVFQRGRCSIELVVDDSTGQQRRRSFDLLGPAGGSTRKDDS